MNTYKVYVFSNLTPKTLLEIKYSIAYKMYKQKNPDETSSGL